MSHLTLAGKRCRVSMHRDDCVFHRRTRSQSSKKVTRRRGGALPGAMGAGRPLRRRKSKVDLSAGRRKYEGPAERYIPKWDSVRKGIAASKRYPAARGTTRGGYTAPRRKRNRKDQVRWAWQFTKDLMREITGVPFPGEPWSK